MFRATEASVDLTHLTLELLLRMMIPLLLIACVALIWAGHHLCTRIADLIEARWDREDDWQQVEAIYRGVLDDYATYLADPYARVRPPGSRRRPQPGHRRVLRGPRTCRVPASGPSSRRRQPYRRVRPRCPDAAHHLR